MYRIGFICGLVLAATTTNATTSIAFSGDQATVTVEGSSGDSDASNLFAAMNVSSIDLGTTLSKQLSFSNSAGTRLFDLSCSISKTEANSGSCVLQIYKVDGMVFDPSNKQVIQSIQGISDAMNVAKLFSRPDDQTGIIYFSADVHLGLSLDLDGGYPELFMIQYN